MESITSEADRRETSETLLVLQLASHVEGVLVSFCILLSIQKYGLGSLLKEQSQNIDLSTSLEMTGGSGLNDN